MHLTGDIALNVIDRKCIVSVHAKSCRMRPPCKPIDLALLDSPSLPQAGVAVQCLWQSS